jgi:hypothetical protein
MAQCGCEEISQQGSAQKVWAAMDLETSFDPLRFLIQRGL